MAVKPLTRKAAMVLGAVHGHLAPKLAQDAKLDLAPVFADVTAANYATRKETLSAAIIEAAKGKLAQDADLADLAALLDAFSGVDPAEEAPAVEGAPGAEGEDDDGLEMDAPAAEAAPGAPEAAGDPIEQVKAFLKGKLSDEDMQQLDALVAKIGGGGEEPEAAKEAPLAKAEGAGDPADKGEFPPAKADAESDEPKQANDKETENMVTKPAMDAAIAEAEKRAAATVLKAQRDLRDAERAVRPYVGEIAVACDSAEQVYRTALKMRGIADAEKIHVSALPAMLKMLPTAAAQARSVPIALDAAAADDFAKRFPHANRLSA